jgi:hypothetical protein
MTLLMPIAPRITDAWQIRHLSDLAWDVSLAAERLIADGHGVCDDHLVGFWVGSRGLANHWLRGLAEWNEAVQMESDWRAFNALATEMLTGEMLLRLWCTVLSVQDKQAGQSNAKAVLDLVVFNLQHVRHQLLNVLLDEAAEFAELDRLRRRCERWTDVLLGPLVVRHGHAQYAQDARRAWDFGEDAAASASSDIAARMLRSGYLTAFDGGFSGERVSSEHWAAIIAGIDQHAAGTLGQGWPGRWREPVSQSFATGSRPDCSANFIDEERPESGFVRALRRAQERRRID